MAHWIALGTQLGKKAPTTYGQLTEQMIPFESELTKSHDNRFDRAHGPDLAPVKAISAQAGLGMKSCEIGIDRQPGGRVCAKALKLGMMRVPTRSTLQHCLGQQGFPPDSDQSLRVKMPGVQRPETHLFNRRGAIADSTRSPRGDDPDPENSRRTHPRTYPVPL